MSSRGWCNTHYERWRRLGTINLSSRPLPEDRFWSFTRKAPGCWEWTGSMSRGYGQLLWEGKVISAPRISWFLSRGRWPIAGHDICHRCDNRACVKPAHLFEGTRSDNVRDAVAKGRHVHRLAKIDYATAERIRALAQEGKTQVEIARVFGLSASNISYVVNRKTWKLPHERIA